MPSTEMGAQNFIINYIQACTSGKLPFSECGPIWQMFVILAFLVAAIAVLLVLRMRPRPSAE
jgi:maltodextrin utilization protein YvdJ